MKNTTLAFLKRVHVWDRTNFLTFDNYITEPFMAWKPCSRASEMRVAFKETTLWPKRYYDVTIKQVYRVVLVLYGGNILKLHDTHNVSKSLIHLNTFLNDWMLVEDIKSQRFILICTKFTKYTTQSGLKKYWRKLFIFSRIKTDIFVNI